ncbi:MAG: SMI1/KNR4 family protein [Pseudomonadales bacterium]|nr:SMI1/KNR4 family protein [Pseudomonadales bacterium]NRA14988.1 SMI1/KNR4 family protein [Oceanospirillaceae bacterium]
MNEIVEQLRELNQDRFGSIELPDEDQLVIIQEQLLLHLPADLKDFLLNVSDVVYGSITPVTVTDEYASSHLPEVTFLAWDRGMPREYIPICQYLDGYYFIAQEGYISVWRPRTGIDEDANWDNIWVWCEQVWLAGAPR